MNQIDFEVWLGVWRSSMELNCGLSCCAGCRPQCQRMRPRSDLLAILGAPTPAVLTACQVYLHMYAGSCAAVWAILIVVQVSNGENATSASTSARCRWTEQLHRCRR